MNRSARIFFRSAWEVAKREALRELDCQLLILAFRVAEKTGWLGLGEGGYGD